MTPLDPERDPERLYFDRAIAAVADWLATQDGTAGHHVEARDLLTVLPAQLDEWKRRAEKAEAELTADLSAGDADWRSRALQATSAVVRVVAAKQRVEAGRDAALARAEKAEAILAISGHNHDAIGVYAGCPTCEREAQATIERDALRERLKEARKTLSAIADAVTRCEVHVWRKEANLVRDRSELAGHAIFFHGDDWFSVQAAADALSFSTPTEEKPC